MGDQLQLLGEVGETGVRTDPNPMVRLFGLGPDVTCQACRHLRAHHRATPWGVCAVRQSTVGMATDHHLRWRACAKYEGAR